MVAWRLILLRAVIAPRYFAMIMTLTIISRLVYLGL
jgi:hypothetical protein